MYEDYKGHVTIDTIDNIRTLEEYALKLGVNTDLYNVLRIEIVGSPQLVHEE